MLIKQLRQRDELIRAARKDIVPLVDWWESLVEGFFAFDAAAAPVTFFGAMGTD